MVLDSGGERGHDGRGEADKFFGIVRVGCLLRVVACVQRLNDPQIAGTIRSQVREFNRGISVERDRFVRNSYEALRR